MVWRPWLRCAVLLSAGVLIRALPSLPQRTEPFAAAQGACRLLPNVGIHLPEDMKLPEQLVELQKLMAKGDPAALKVYEALGIEFGYTLAHWAEFYDYSALLIMGRVTSGPGGEVMITKARQVLADEFPELSIDVIQPSEKDKRHGQAIAAGSLPATKA